MSRLGLYVMCGALCSLVLLGGTSAASTNEVIPVPHTTSTTTPVPTTDSPSPNDTTTPVPTIKPPSPTTPPTTPHTPPTTPPTPPTTPPTPPTTPPTPPTTPPAPAPTPKPTPLPPPSVGNYTWKQDNVTCIMVQFAAQLNVTYTKGVDNSTTLGYVVLNVPANASVINGSCSALNGTQQWLTLSWPVGNLTANNMTLVFFKNGTNYVLQNLNVTLPAKLFPNASLSNSVELSHGVEWQTPLATSYRCGPATALNLTADSPATAGTLTISQLQEEAFRTSTGTGFSAARDCGSGDVPDAVPIAVGCALGGLVIVVLVAYLVGRRRSAARGYLSM